MKKIILSVCLFSVLSCANLKKDAQIENVKKVKGEVVKQSEIPNTIDGFGTLSYQKKVDVISKQEGSLAKIYFKEGQKINKGDVVVMLENPQILLAVERAENMLEQAESALFLAEAALFDAELQAEANLLSLEKSDAEMAQAWKSFYEEEHKQESQEIIYEAGGISDEAIRAARFEFESKRTSLELAEKELEIKKIGFREKDLINAGIEVPQGKEEKLQAFVKLLTRKSKAEIAAAISRKSAAEKELKSALIAKDELVIRSPINGILAVKYPEEGEHVKGEDKLLTIMDNEYLYAVIPVSETDAFKLQTGMESTVEIDGTNNTYSGKIDLINPYADSASYTFSVRILISKEGLQNKGLQNKENSLGAEFPKPGMFSRVSISLGAPRSVVSVKESAIFNINNDQGAVFVVNGKSIIEKNVTLGVSYNGSREIKSGLNINEVAVLQPDSDLQEGDYVSIVQ
ncbi:MAG: efflux RND transporter periplasmic adaptor subunit [Termitinemataceae bacterium]|nr:MAG: efflux RND transporter periplasmic adaptor subunit [Termitinemataceae bacterium]